MEFIVALFALAALAWTAVVFLRGGLLGGALVVLLAGSCFGHPFFRINTSPIPLTADRLLLALLALQYLVYRHWGWIEPKPLARADYLLAGLLVVLLASTFTHDFQYERYQPVSQLLFYYLMPAVLYWVVRQTDFTARGAWCMFGSLAAFGAYLCLTAVAETHGAWSLVFPRYIGSLEFTEFYGRGRGPLLNPVANGLVQGLGLCAAVLWWPRLNRPGQMLLALATLAIFGWGLYSTMTRSVWMGAAAGLVVIAALAMPRGWRGAVVGAALLVATFSTVVGWEQLLSFKRDKNVSAEEVAESVRLRPILATVAWHMFLDRPVVGCGFGQYVPESRPYLADRTTELPLEKGLPYKQHNTFLALLTETGIVGLALFVGLLASWSHVAWRLWRSEEADLWVRLVGLLFLAFMGVYLPNAMFHDVSIIPMVNMFLFFLGGAVMSLTPWVVHMTKPERLKLWVPGHELTATH